MTVPLAAPPLAAPSLAAPPLADPVVADLLRRFEEAAGRFRRTQARLASHAGRLQAELQEKNALLRQRNRLAEMGEMVASLAHEIRNPLGGIRLSVGMLRRRLPADGAEMRLARRIEEGTDDLARVVEEMLLWAREDRFAPGRCDLSALAREAAFGVPEGVAVRIEGADRPFPHGAAAPMVARALANLVRNACEAMGGRGTLTLSLAREGDEARIAVSDTGPGVAEGDRDRVFRPFFTRRARGTGLGLAIVARAARAHGGSGRVERAEGGGARFVLALRDAAAPAPRRAARSRNPAAAGEVA